MLLVLSPAKKLLSDFGRYNGHTSQPIFAKQTCELVQIMKNKSSAEITNLMDLSKDLAQLNYDRYQSFAIDGADGQVYPALFFFQGDVYQGLQASSWNAPTIEFAQSHLRILSGLYGLLRPLDVIQAYRLEMGVRLKNPLGNTLYDFWSNSISQQLNKELDSQKNPLLINLASSEYFKAVNERTINHPIVTVNFYEQKNNSLKMVGIHAKKARGLMAKFLMQNQIDDLSGLKKFNDAGYYFVENTSNATTLNFVRSSS